MTEMLRSGRRRGRGAVVAVVVGIRIRRRQTYALLNLVARDTGRKHGT